MSRRVNIRAILADPVQRREMAVRFIMSAQAMEGIETTREQAEAAYDRVVAERGEPKPRFPAPRGKLPDIDLD